MKRLALLATLLAMFCVGNAQAYPLTGWTIDLTALTGDSSFPTFENIVALDLFGNASAVLTGNSVPFTGPAAGDTFVQTANIDTVGYTIDAPAPNNRNTFLPVYSGSTLVEALFFSTTLNGTMTSPYDYVYTPGSTIYMSYYNSGVTYDVARFTLLAGGGSNETLGSLANWDDFYQGTYGILASLDWFAPGVFTSPYLDLQALLDDPDTSIEALLKGSYNITSLEVTGPNTVTFTTDPDGGAQFEVTPEPSTILLLGMGALGLAFFKRRKEA